MVLLKISEAASILKVEKFIIYQLIKKEELPAVKITKRTYRIREHDLQAYIRANTKEEPAASSFFSQTRDIYARFFRR
jgi:excisionase family DNA binding protein